MMGTVRLLWFFLWRMSLFGPVLGAVLGTAYAILLSMSLLLFASFTYESVEPAVANTLSAIVLIVLYGVFFGVLLGTPVGLVLGPLVGLLVGVLTHVFYYPTPDNPRRYCLIAGAACAVASVLAYFVIWNLSDIEEGLGTFLGGWFGLVLPALIATLAMSLLGVLVAAWYVRTTRRIAGSDEGTPAAGEHPEVG